jgi:hypothetical protein
VPALDAGLHVIDIADLAQPRLVQTIPTNGRAYDVSVASSRVAVADGDGGVLLLRLADMVATPAPTATASASPIASATVVAGGSTATSTHATANPTVLAPTPAWPSDRRVYLPVAWRGP